VSSDRRRAPARRADGDGLADFHMLRYRRGDAAVHLCAFDLIEIDGRDLRDEPIEARKAELARVFDGCRPGLVLNRTFDDPGRLRARVQVWLRRHCEQTAGLALFRRPNE
jgi:ATP-dependent DNA ligase